LKIFTLSFLLSLLGVAWVSATPSISNVTWSGNLLEGTTLTISLSGGGTKSNGRAKPIIWANFEQSTIAPHAVYSSSTSWTGIENMVYTGASTNCYSGNGCVMAQPNWESSNKATLEIHFEDLGYGTSYYWSEKYQSNAVINSTWNFKQDRMWRNTAGVKPDFFVGQQNDGSHEFQIESQEGSNTTHIYTSFPNALYLFAAPAWHELEYYVRMSSGTFGATGYLQIWQDGVIIDTETAMVYSTVGSPGVEDDYFFQLNYAQGSCGANCPSDLSGYAPLYVHYDELYLDTSWAHVAISSMSTQSAAAFTAPCPATAWADTSITAILNQSNYTNGQTVYLYVYDNNKLVNSNGFPLAIGSTTGGTPVCPCTFHG
jgi:hypothetical protein